MIEYDYYPQKKIKNKNLLGRLNESTNDFIFDYNTNAEEDEIGSVGPGAGGLADNFRRSTVGENSVSYCQEIERNNTDTNKKEFDMLIQQSKIGFRTCSWQR